LQLSASADAHCDQLIICLFIVSRKTDARFKPQVKLIEFVGTIVTQKYRNIEMVDITVRDLLFYLFSSALVTTNKRIINKPESQPQPIQNGPDSPFYTLLKDPKNRRDAKKLEEKISTINFKDRWTFWTDSVKAQAMSKEDFSKNIHKSGHCSNLKVRDEHISLRFSGFLTNEIRNFAIIGMALQTSYTLACIRTYAYLRMIFRLYGR
jgi:hypothetical protein